MVGDAGMREALLQKENLVPEMDPEQPYTSIRHGPEPIAGEPAEPHPLLPFLRTARTSSLFSLRDTLAQYRPFLPHERYEQYNQAINLLDEIMLYVCVFPRIRSLVRAIFIWPCKVPSDFAEALSRGDKFALILYAHWLMMTVLLEDLWIVSDMGRAGIFEIITRSGEWTESEQALLSWPIKLLSRSALEE